MTSSDPIGSHQLTHPMAFAVAAVDDDTFADRFFALREEFPQAAIWKVRGSKMRTLPAMFDEFGAALQFPYYFGENWAALDDCLGDLDWADAIDHLLMITDAHLLLAAEPVSNLASLLESLVDAHTAWGQPPSDGVVRTFRTIIQVPPEYEAVLWSRLAEAGYATD